MVYVDLNINLISYEGSREENNDCRKQLDDGYSLIFLLRASTFIVLPLYTIVSFDLHRSSPLYQYLIDFFTKEFPCSLLFIFIVCCVFQNITFIFALIEGCQMIHMPFQLIDNIVIFKVRKRQIIIVFSFDPSFTIKKK